MLLGEVVARRITGQIGQFRSAHVLADGDEFHLRSDDPRSGISQLGDALAWLRPESPAAVGGQPGEFDQSVLLGLAGIFGVLAGKVSVVLRLDLATLVFLHIPSGPNPFCSQCRQALFRTTREIRITPRTRTIVDPHRRIGFLSPAHRVGRVLADLPERHLDRRMQGARHIHAARVGQLLPAVGFERSLGIGDHGIGFLSESGLWI